MKTPSRLVAPLALTSVLLIPNITHAQTYIPSNRIPVADNSLGTQVSGNNNNFSIVGGLQKGQTLFHSFSDFSVPTNGQANFLNPVGNRDIITRVTGGLFSDLNGTVRTQGANFFLINLNGVVFGPNAQLNVGKAFVGSTANSLDLVDGGGRTITFGANPNGDAPLLSVNPNVFFNVSRLNMGGGTGAISNFGTLQTLNHSQYIGLIGGNVTLNGSQGGGKIIAPGGRVDIGGLKSDGTITVGNNGMVFGGSGVRSDVSLINGANVTVRATGTLDTVQTFFNNVTAPGSSINISANNLDILNSGTQSATQPPALDAGLDLNSGVQTKAAGDIKIDVTGKVNVNNSVIKNTLRSGAEGSIGGIKIKAGTLDINNSAIATNTSGKGNAGNIDISVIGDINISGYDPSSANFTSSYISNDTYGQGDAGKITINTQGKLSIFNQGEISNTIASTAVGNSGGITIAAGGLKLANYSDISAFTYQTSQVNGKGNSGDININITGDINISGSDSPTNPTSSYIYNNTYGQGDAGKITINTQGKFSLLNNGEISSTIDSKAIGNSKGISIAAAGLKIANNSDIATRTLQAAKVDGKGNAGDININTTGDIQISGYDSSSTNPVTANTSKIASITYGQGNAGEVGIDIQGKLSLSNNGVILSTIADSAVGNSKGIRIAAAGLEIANNSNIATDTFQNTQVYGKGNAGDINIKTTGDINISGYNPSSTFIRSSTDGQGDAGKITIDTQGKLSLINGGLSSTIGQAGVGNSKGIKINADALTIANGGTIQTSSYAVNNIIGKGNAGSIDIQATGDIKLLNRTNTLNGIVAISNNSGAAGDIFINTKGNLFLNGSTINSYASSVSGGNITLNISDKLFMANYGNITTTSDSTGRNGNGGNITISSPLIIAIPGSNDISANAYQGTGGNINITSQGLFGIQYRAKGQESPFTNDVTASSTFGQNGIVTINTPGTDPGKDKGELTAAPNDASKQISQACSASQRDNKFYMIGRGGHPANAEDPLTSDVVWRDPRIATMQPVASNVNSQTTRKLAPPAVGWVFDGKGKVTLIAAQTDGAPTGTKVVCPNVGR
jgi:filamentous hemagglutinin family protein